MRERGRESVRVSVCGCERNARISNDIQDQPPSQKSYFLISGPGTSEWLHSSSRSCCNSFNSCCSCCRSMSRPGTSERLRSFSSNNNGSGRCFHLRNGFCKGMPSMKPAAQLQLQQQRQRPMPLHDLQRTSSAVCICTIVLVKQV